MGRHAVVVAAALAAALAVPAIAPAAQFPVSSTADVADANPGAGGCDTGAGLCTLRAAVQEANAVGGPDTITLPAGNFALSIPGAVEDLGVTGDLDVSESVEIRGARVARRRYDDPGCSRPVRAGPPDRWCEHGPHRREPAHHGVQRSNSDLGDRRRWTLTHPVGRLRRSRPIRAERWAELLAHRP